MLDAPLPQEAPPEGSPDVQKLKWWRKENDKAAIAKRREISQKKGL